MNFSDEDDSGYIKKDFFQTTLLNQLKGISKQMIYSFVETLFQNNQSISSKSLKQNMSDLFKSSSPSTSLSIPQIPPKKEYKKENEISKISKTTEDHKEILPLLDIEKLKNKLKINQNIQNFLIYLRKAYNDGISILKLYEEISKKFPYLDENEKNYLFNCLQKCKKTNEESFNIKLIEIFFGNFIGIELNSPQSDGKLLNITHDSSKKQIDIPRLQIEDIKINSNTNTFQEYIEIPIPEKKGTLPIKENHLNDIQKKNQNLQRSYTTKNIDLICYEIKKVWPDPIMIYQSLSLQSDRITINIDASLIIECISNKISFLNKEQLHTFFGPIIDQTEKINIYKFSEILKVFLI